MENIKKFKTAEYRLFPDKQTRKKLEQKLNAADAAFDSIADTINELADVGVRGKLLQWELSVSKCKPTLAPVEEEFIKKQIQDLLFEIDSGEIERIYHRNRNRGHRTLRIDEPTVMSDTAEIDGIGVVPITVHRELPEDAHIYMTALKEDCNGAEFYLVYSYYFNAPVAETVEIDCANVLGLDYAQDGLYVSSNGESGDYPGFKRMGSKRLLRYRDAANRFNVGSSRWKKYQRRLKKYEKHIRNQRENWQYKTAGYLAETYDAVCHENLDFAAMYGSNPALKPKIIDNNWAGFEKKLSEKLTENGKKIVEIPQYYPSSQICSSCGYTVGKLPLSQRLIECPACGSILDRDVNAAKNIRDKGIELLNAA